jgi:hypothetical protein
MIDGARAVTRLADRIRNEGIGKLLATYEEESFVVTCVARARMAAVCYTLFRNLQLGAVRVLSSQFSVLSSHGLDFRYSATALMM